METIYRKDMNAVDSLKNMAKDLRMLPVVEPEVRASVAATANMHPPPRMQARTGLNVVCCFFRFSL